MSFVKATTSELGTAINEIVLPAFTCALLAAYGFSLASKLVRVIDWFHETARPCVLNVKENA